MNGKKYIAFFIAAFIASIWMNAYAQDNLITIKSVVKNSNGQPITGALISVNEGAIETTTDSNGNFTVEVRRKTDLLVEANGYENKIIYQSEVIPSEIILEVLPFLMGDDDRVNIAFGKVKNREVVGAVSTVNSEKVRKTDTNESVAATIVGKIPGLHNYNGLNIRGLGAPLLVIDGLPRNVAYINLSEIEQVTVLKDGYSAMLWGSQAKNGVIQITTKRGIPYKRKMNFSVDYGFATPVALPKYLGSADYFRLYNEALANDGLPPAYSEETIARYNGSNPYRYPDVDYYSKEYLKDMLPTTRVISEFAGGNSNAHYYVNLGWYREGKLYNLGKAADMANNRFNLRANVDFKINDFIKSSLDGVMIFSKDQNPAGNFWNDASTLHPDYYSPLLPISKIKNTTALNDILATARLINNEYILGGTQQYQSNPYGNMFLAGYRDNNQRTLTVNNTIDVNLDQLTEGLTFKSFFGVDIFNTYSVVMSDTYAVYAPTWDANDSISGLSKINQDTRTGDQSLPIGERYFERSIASYLSLDYNRTFNQNHTVSGTLLAYYYVLRMNNVLLDVKNAHLGLRIAYDYRKKYFADFSSTYTNGFRLAPGRRGGYAPSLGLGWVISEEDFLNSNKVDYLKIRASASIQNVDLDNISDGHPYDEDFVQAGMNFDWGDGQRGTQTHVIRHTANSRLTFQKMKSMNFGIEGFFFDNLLYAGANVFSNWYTGQVIRRSIYPALIGAFYPWENYNNTKYTGVDMELGLKKTHNDFSYDLGFNFLYAKSERTKVSELWGEDYLYRKGKPADVIYGLEALGLFQNETEIANSPIQTYSVPMPGDIKYKDQNGDGVINSNDQIELGNSVPRFTYGLNLLLQYKNISLMASGTGYTGFNYMYSNDYFWIDGNKKYSVEVLNRWTPETSATADYPRLSTRSNTNNYQTSTYWLKEGNYFALNRAQLTYYLPKSLLGNWIIKDFSIYARGSNLCMFGIDQKKWQLNPGYAPNNRVFALGINVLF